MKALNKTIVAVAAIVLSAGASAVNLSTTIGNTNTTSITAVNTSVTGTTSSTTVDYSQNRGTVGPDVNGNACGVGKICSGNDTLNVGIDINVTQRDSIIDQITTGVNMAETVSCDVTVSIGSLSNSQGTNTRTFDNETVTHNNNVTQITSANVSVSTQTDEGYLSGGNSKPGNDFTLNIGNQHISSEGDSINVVDLANVMLSDDFTVSVSGQDLNHADTNALSVTWGTEDLQVIDTGVTTNTSVGTTTTYYENN